MFFRNVIVLQVLNILTCKGVATPENAMVKGNYKTWRNGSIYLNRNRPLWILQDHSPQTQNNLFKPLRKYENLKTFKHDSTHSPSLLRASKTTPFHEKENLWTKTQKRFNKKGIQLPRNYIPFANAGISNSLPATRKYKNSKFIKNMPVFDAVPGEESFGKLTPIFIYTGNKGRMLFNTMLSKDKYPMREPVPGQVLYPPKPLEFKPKPLIETLKRNVNVTMIPFYAYEAMQPTTLTPTALFQPAKKSKKSKHYTAFFSPEEVHSKPTTDNFEQPTTWTPLVLDNPYANHRLEDVPPPTTTPLPHKKLEVTYNDGEDKFQITYEGDNMPLERPLNAPPTRFTTTQSPVPYESYTLDDNYYAFPVYTMSKLMENNADTQTSDNVSIERQRIEEIIDTALKDEKDNLINNQSNEDTWFILNSRYKGPLKKSSTSTLHSSKYVQTSPAKTLDPTTTKISS